jgi:uncharacterized membrane protein YbhN (UPF0104 family)
MTKLSKTYNTLIRFAILVFTFYFLYKQLFFKHDLGSFFQNIKAVIHTRHFVFWFSVTVGLMPLNLLLESRKWQYLMYKLEKITLWEAYKAVLAGISVSVFLPNRVGDYLGRVFVLKKADRIQATLATILGSLAQLLTTLLFGLTSVALFLPRWINTDSPLNRWIIAGLVFSILFTMALFIFGYLNFSVFSEILRHVSGRAYNKVARYTEVFSWYSVRELLFVLVISILRYGVFSFQFYLLLHIFKVPVSYGQAMMVIGFIYLLMSIIPTIALSEIGVRGSVSLYAFGLFFSVQPGEMLNRHIIAASSALWLLNLAIPAVFGLLFIFKLRFFRNNNHRHER